MTLDELKKQFRAGKLGQAGALQVTATLLKGATEQQTVQILSFMDEVLGIESEPRPMSTSERESAERWEKGYRGDDK